MTMAKMPPAFLKNIKGDKAKGKEAPAKGKMPMADKGGKKMPAFLMKMKKGK